MKNRFLTTNIILTLVSLLILNACVPVAIIGGAGALGYTAVQERSIGSAVDDVSIETQVSALMISNKNKGKFSDAHVDSVEGRVLLPGSVESREDK